MSADVFDHMPDEDRDPVEVDAAQILDASLDLRDVPFDDDDYDHEAA